MSDSTGIGKATESVAQISQAVLSTVEKFCGPLLKPGLERAGEMIVDQLDYWRWQRRLTIVQQVEKRISRLPPERRVNATKLAPDFVVRVLDRASYAGESILQERWAQLLANGAESTGVQHPAFVDVLAQLSGHEAELLDRLEKVPAGVPVVGVMNSRIYVEQLMWQPDPTEPPRFLGLDYENLQRLGLLELKQQDVRMPENSGMKWTGTPFETLWQSQQLVPHVAGKEVYGFTAEITDFGRSLVRACRPT